MHITYIKICEKFDVVKGNYRTLSYLFKRTLIFGPVILIKLRAQRMHFRQCIT